MKRFLIICLLCIFSGTVISMSIFEKGYGGSGGDIFEPEVFGSVTINTTESTDCSPKDLGPDWLGIAIAMPNSITRNAAAASTQKGFVPLCGFYQLELKALVANESPLRFFITNLVTKARYQGDFLEIDENPEAPLPEPNEPIDPSSLEGMLAGSYFNPNLRDYVDFPKTSGAYDVYVEYGGMQSNTVNVEIIVK